MAIPKVLDEWIKKKLLGVNKYAVKQYYASLLHCAYTKAFPLKDMASEVGVHPVTIRKWRANQRFRALNRWLAEEFAHYYLDYAFKEGKFDGDDLLNFSLDVWAELIEQLEHVLENANASPEEELAMACMICELHEMYVNWRGSKQDRIEFYSYMRSFVPEALARITEHFDRTLDSGDIEEVRGLYHELASTYHDLDETCHKYWEKLVRAGLI